MADKTADSSELEQQLELLWHGRPERRRGPQPGLTVHAIVETAIDMADAGGLEELSMVLLAKRLGVAPMTLYRYVLGKSGLIALMLDTATGDPPPLHEVAGDWRAKLERWAADNLAVFQRHPWALQVVTTRRVIGPNELAWFEAALHALSDSGLTPRKLVDVIVLVSDYVRGAAQGVVSAAQAQRSTGTAERAWAPRYTDVLRRVVDDRRHPTFAAVLRSGALDQPPADDGELLRGFRFGLHRVLDGIQTLLDQQASQSQQ